MKRIIVLFVILFVWCVQLFPKSIKNSVDIHPRFRHGFVSSRNLLHRSPFYRDDHTILRKASVEISQNPDVLNILALRVEFQPDENDSTTGDGRFDLSVPAELIIDPPPHHRGYFHNQMQALANYYQMVSDGNLILNWDVSADIFILPQEMSYYNPGTIDADVDRGLAELFRDAILAADGNGILFSDYDCFIIFHAGVGRDFNLGYDLTPSDIPSAFVGLDDLQEQLGAGDPGYQGIEVEGGSFHVPEGIILPETQNQEGFEFGLLGTMALMFGFQIGMPAMWDTDTGLSGIGRWGLMDQGSGNYSGLIPAEPCAWNKVYLGWEEPVEIRQGEVLQVVCSRASGSDKIFKVPINDHEYFLIENRQYDFNDDSVAVGMDSSGAEITFLPDGTLEVTQAAVVVSVDEYDYGLPGSGILIWHIDEQVILDGLADNTINVDSNNRGVDLEEADGAQDIGEEYGFTSPGYGAEVGVYHDAWFVDNEINMLVNNSDEVAFTPNSYPASVSNSGANSHIIIDGFSVNDSVMTFSVHSDLLQEGFPQFFGENFGIPYPPLFGNMEGDRELEIFITTQDGFIFGWNPDGTMIGDNITDAFRIDISGDTIRFPVSYLIEESDGFSVSPAFKNRPSGIFIGTNNGDVKFLLQDQNDQFELVTYGSGYGNITSMMSTRNHIVVGTSDSFIYGVGDSLQSNWQTNINYSVTGLCLFGEWSNQNILATGPNGYVTEIDNVDGSIVWTSQIMQNDFGITSASLSQPDVFSFVSIDEDGIGNLFDIDGNLHTSFGNQYEIDPICSPAIGDIDSDGFMEIVMTGSGKILVFNHNGSLSDNFPIPHYERDLVLSSPVLGDVDGDSNIDIVIATSEGNIEAWRNDGSMVDGFPLSTGSTETIAPTLLDLDGDGDIEIAAVSEKGYLFIWDMPGTYTPDLVPWGHWRYDPALTGLNRQTLDPPEPVERWTDKMLLYNYPNPTEGNLTTIRYRLEQEADVEIKIYDMAGELVDEFSGPGFAQTENEVRWDLSDVESSVYFCRVKARTDQIEKTAICKIVVVK